MWRTFIFCSCAVTVLKLQQAETAGEKAVSNLTSTFLHPREERRPKRSPKKKPPSVRPVSGHAARERLIIGAKYASISLGVYLLGYFGYNFLIFVLAPVAAVAVAQQRKDERRRKVKCQIMRAVRVNLRGIFTVTESGVKAICSKLRRHCGEM